jgi:hypothetical protein
MNTQYLLLCLGLLLINITEHADYNRTPPVKKPLSMVLGKSCLWSIGALLSFKSSMIFLKNAHSCEQEANMMLMIPINKASFKELPSHCHNRAANLRSTSGLLAIVGISCVGRSFCDLSNYARQHTKKP